MGCVVSDRASKPQECTCALNRFSVGAKNTSGTSGGIFDQCRSGKETVTGKRMVRFKIHTKRVNCS